jgi:carbon storage regulator CsrA
MLVLSRRIGEEIAIAGDIHVKVVAIKGHCVRLGIKAPASVRVARQELLDGSCEGSAAQVELRKGDNQQSPG